MTTLSRVRSRGPGLSALELGGGPGQVVDPGPYPRGCEVARDREIQRLVDEANRRRATECTGKVRYASAQSADVARSRMRIKMDCEVNAYLCIFCDAWHIGRAYGTKRRPA